MRHETRWMYKTGCVHLKRERANMKFYRTTPIKFG